MSHKWGINWMRYHPEQADFEHIARMQYRSVTIYEWMWNNANFCRDLLSVLPQDAIILCRDHPLSEQKEDMERDPAGTGRRHADEWAAKVRDGRVHIPVNRAAFLGINEPDSNRLQRQIDTYNEAYCRRMSAHGLRAAAYSFGVGHPSSVGLQPDTPSDWSWYAASAAAVLEGRHLAAFHEYGAPDGYGWGYWCNRVADCPYAFDAIVEECGIDYGVVVRGQLEGWQVHLNDPAGYVSWLDGYQLGMAERAAQRKVNILAYNLFCYDHNDDWWSFNIKPVRQQLETFRWSVPQVNTPQVNTPQPVPQPGPDTNWERSIAFVLRWEGGYVNDPRDPGGETNWGITRRSYPHLDIKNLTREQAVEIYHRDYWQASGADKLPWPLCLAHFDTAVNAGVGRAQKTLADSGGNFLHYMGILIDWYTRIANFEHFGRAWIRRRAEILLEAVRS